MNYELINKLEGLIATAHRFKSAYYWTAPATASERRSYEKRNSIPKFQWEEGGHEYTAAFTVNCSCRNVYAYGTYTKDGVKTTLTAVKNSLKRLTATC